MTCPEAPDSAMGRPCQEQEEEQWAQSSSMIKVALVGLSLQQEEEQRVSLTDTPCSSTLLLPCTEGFPGDHHTFTDRQTQFRGLPMVLD